MSELIYYVNGELVPADQAALPLDDLGIVRGYGIFDLLRTYGTTPFGLREHVQRLERSAEQIGLALPWRTEELEGIVLDTYAANEIPDASIRIIVTGGPSANFLTPEDRPAPDGDGASARAQRREPVHARRQGRQHAGGSAVANGQEPKLHGRDPRHAGGR